MSLAQLSIETRKILGQLDLSTTSLEVMNNFNPAIKDIISSITYPKIYSVYTQLIQRYFEQTNYNGHEYKFILLILAIAHIYYRGNYQVTGCDGFLDLIAMYNPTLFTACKDFMNSQSPSETPMRKWVSNFDIKLPHD